MRSGLGRRRSRWKTRVQGCGKIGRTPDDRAARCRVASRQIFQSRFSRKGGSVFVTAGVAGLALVLSGLVLGWFLAGPGMIPQGMHEHTAQGMFMDLLMGGARAAEAAARAASALPETSEPALQAQVFTWNGRTVREYTLVIQEKVFDYGGGNRWRAWTFNGTVPGPTLRVRKGEILRVRVVNRHRRVHSFHAHLSRYPLEMDGSQANIITGRAPGAMIPPGREYVYEFLAEEAGATYYHCHSADREFPINQHILQGLYGAILVEDPAMKPMREGVVFMAETGQLRSGANPPFYIMNGMGIPGGELALEEIYKKQGLKGVVAQLGKTVPYFKLKTGEAIKLHVYNFGNLNHTFHAHGVRHVSLAVLQGRPWPGNVVPLLSGTLDTLLLEFRHPGLWLFHCHVVNHADAGMIGVFVVEP